MTGVLILVFVAGETNSTSYEGTVEAACGPVVKVFSELCLVAFCFGSNTAYLVVIEDQLEDGMYVHRYLLSFFLRSGMMQITDIALIPVCQNWSHYF